MNAPVEMRDGVSAYDWLRSVAELVVARIGQLSAERPGCLGSHQKRRHRRGTRGCQAGGWKFECSAASPLPLALGFREAQPPPIFEANSCENTLQKEIATRDKILKLQSVLL